MYPHERSLVERLKDEPFTIVGVNSDPAERYRTAVADNRITWPSFADGGTTGGPIATRWSVTGWPTVYVIDHKGIIRSVGHSLDEDLVDRLIEEMKRD